MEEEEPTPKSIIVDKPLHVDVDLGNLLLSDTNEIAVKSLKYGSVFCLQQFITFN